MTTKLFGGKNANRTASRESRNIDDSPRRSKCFSAPIDAAEFLREKALKRVQWGVSRQRGASDIGLLCSKKNCLTQNCMTRGELVDAQNIINRAMTEQCSDMRVRLAKAALKFSPLCVDAHLTLFYEEMAEGSPDYKVHAFNALRAGLEIMGISSLKNRETRFYTELKTRPWMRAMLALGDLYSCSDIEKSIEIWNKLLECDRSDGLNVRRALVPALLDQGYLCDAGELIDQFIHEGSTAISLSALLFCWKQLGASAVTELAMWEALCVNSHILDILESGTLDSSQRDRFFAPNSREDAEEFMAKLLTHFGPTSDLAKWMLEVVQREAKSFKFESPYRGKGIVI